MICLYCFVRWHVKLGFVVANVPFGMPAVTIDNNGAIKLQEKGHVGNDK